MLTSTHRELCESGKDWLTKTRRCNPVFMEKGTAVSSEMPDVIGWTKQGSILIECKASRSDFLADKNKPHRKGKGMGNLRYYLCADSSVIKPEDLLEGWGLLYLDWHHCARQAVGAIPREDKDINIRGEMGFLRSRILEIQRFGR